MQPNNIVKHLEDMNKLMTSSMDYSRAQCLKNCALDIIQIMKDEMLIEDKKNIDNRKMFLNISNKVMDLAKSYQDQAKKLEKFK